jgi:hypothetical protein
LWEEVVQLPYLETPTQSQKHKWLMTVVGLGLGVSLALSGGLAMDPSPDTFWGAPSLRMWSDGGTLQVWDHELASVRKVRGQSLWSALTAKLENREILLAVQSMTC